MKFMETAKAKLEKLNGKKDLDQEDEALKAELCWALSNLKQDKINVSEYAL